MLVFEGGCMMMVDGYMLIVLELGDFLLVLVVWGVVMCSFMLLLVGCMLWLVV